VIRVSRILATQHHGMDVVAGLAFASPVLGISKPARGVSSESGGNRSRIGRGIALDDPEA
jgi:hypothetical protein